MEFDAMGVLERLILEDDQSVEAWYLGGWCLNLLAEKQETPVTSAEEGNNPESKRHASLIASREWMKQSLNLYKLVEYEDIKLKEHALELVYLMDQELGEDMEADEGLTADADNDYNEWEDEEDEESDENEDHEMADS